MTGPSMATSVMRRARRILTDPRTVGVAEAAPRTVAFMARNWSRNRQASVGLAAQVLLDEVVISAMRNPRLFPHAEDFLRAAADVDAAHEMWERQGWLSDPGSYHLAPPEPSDVRLRTERALGQRYDHLSFPSPYEPHAGEPGRERWLSHEPNRTFHAYVLRHPGPPRPWLVCVHGFGMGRPLMDLRAFRASRLHHGLGLNLLLPVLPLHGPRQDPGTDIGEGLMSINLIDTLHGLAQAAADVRSAILWARDGDADVPVGVYGISLGGYVTALLACLEEGLACAIAGIPATDMPDLYRRHSPAGVRRRAFESGALGPRVDEVMSVVSPLVLAPKPPRERLYVFAGVGDRMSSSTQARRLWEHWDRPQVAWYPGGHVGFFWASGVSRFLDAALVESGLAPARPEPSARETQAAPRPESPLDFLPEAGPDLTLSAGPGAPGPPADRPSGTPSG